MRLFIPLILALYANASFALGLGEATLKSYLGESLIVKLNVTDVEKSPDASCFTVSDTNDTPAFKRAFSTLSTQKDGFLLTITTQSVITEPILSLRVSYHCEPQLHRDYVLLLDPASISSETSGSNVTANPTSTAEKPVSRKTKPSSSADNSTAASDADSYMPPKPKRKLKKRQANAASSADEKIMEAYVGKPQNAAKPALPASTASIGQPAPAKPDTSSKPYLSISGGSLASDTSAGQHNLSLQFETQIDLNRAPPSNPPSSIDLQDEATVMSNRLAHLEKQIMSLQTQNTQLRNEAAQAKNSLAEQQSSWLNYLWIVVAAVLGLAALEWLRRIIITKRMLKQEQHWFDGDENANSEQASFAATTSPSADYKASKQNTFSDSFLDDETDDEYAKTTPSKAGILSPAEHVSDEHDSIIDNADVFIEHERPLLAIQLLQNHLNDFPAESPKIWLKLLSLIAKEGTEAEYEAAVIEANKHFNIKAPNFADANHEDNSSIEEYANIVARLEGVWGSPFAVKFLNDLIYDQYAQPAEGFSPNNFEELFFLKRIAELLNTGISASQHTLYRSAPAKAESPHSNPAPSSLDNAVFNSVAFSDDISSDTDTQNETTEKPKTNTISDEDFTVAPFPEMPEQAVWSRPTQEEMNAQFANSPFQKVPSYEVDMLADFDDHIEVVVPTFDEDIDTTSASEQPTAPALLNNAPSEMAEEFLFPLDIFPEETSSADNASSKPEDDLENKKAKDSNIIEWDLPKSNK
ncbi:hypothetical protein [Methylotenera sp.]|uniref:type IV pilus assembly protein FimV n=1 Tax=Methylotenera sp. TaxID=2051956 RepID=UPI002EDACEC5